MRSVSTALSLAASLALALAFVLPSASAELLEAYDLVGTDPEGDAAHEFAPGADNPGGLFTPARVDILQLEMATEPEQLQALLVIGVPPGGTSGYMYMVSFDVNGTTYFTCWNIQWTGGQDSQEDAVGCEEFSGTRVGPTTQAEGVDVRTVDDKSFVRWEVPRADFGAPVDGTDISGPFAETFTRGADAGDVWRTADRGPDEGAWENYTLGGGVEAVPQTVDVAFTSADFSQTVAQGDTAEFTILVAVVGNGTADVELNVSDVPADWPVAFEPSAKLTNVTGNTTVRLSVEVPADAENGTYPFSATAFSPTTNTTLSLPFSIVVDPGNVGDSEPGLGPGATEPFDDGDGDGASAGQAAQAAVAFVGANAAALAYAHRRYE